MSEWHPIETLPYDTPVLMFNALDGWMGIHFLYDCDVVVLKDEGFTHWMEKPDDPS